MTQFTASEVRDYLFSIEERSSRQWLIAHDAELGMLRQFADLLEARERAVPVAWCDPATIDCAHPTCYKKLEYISIADSVAGVKFVPLYTQPPAASVTDAMVEDGCMAWNKSAGLGYAVADRDCMRAAIEAALAAQENPNG